MLRLTKIFHFEMAHAIDGYPGACRNIHGHSYELHVSVTDRNNNGDNYFPAPGILLDFKELKQLVNTAIMNKFDHQLILSEQFIQARVPVLSYENLFILEVEPTAENLLIFIRRNLETALPAGIELASLKLFETKDSYAEWINDNI